MEKRSFDGGVLFLREPIRPGSGDKLDGRGTRLVGGVVLEHIEHIGGGVYRADLGAQGIKPLPMTSRGFARPHGRSHSELFLDGVPCNISQYPRRGEFLRITGYGAPRTDEWGSVNGRLDGGFFYEDDRPKSWAKSDDLWVHGYWSWDWANTYERVAQLDPERGFVMNAPDYGQYQFKIGQRFYFLNVREEVREPGDYCIDYAENALYFMPYDGAFKEAVLSTADFPAFDIDGMNGVTVENFELDSFAGDAIRVKNSSDVRFTGLRMHNIGSRAAVVTGSTDVVFEGCEVYDCGDGGIDITCGDRATLSPGRCGVRNCDIYNVAKWSRTYTPPVHLAGVGNFAVRNRIHDCPHTAVLYWGNDMEITDNEIYRVLLETGDAGAIYSGRDYTFRGNVVSRNLIALTGGVGMGTMGIYNDDCLSGTLMEDNVFYKVSRALFLGGGRDFVVRGNLCVDCSPGVEIDGRGQSDHPVWRNMVTNTMYERFYNIAPGVSGAAEPYISRYPALADIDAFYKADRHAKIPPSALIEGNVFAGRGIEYTWETKGGEFTERGNVTVAADDDAAIRAAAGEEKYAKYKRALELERCG